MGNKRYSLSLDQSVELGVGLAAFVKLPKKADTQSN